VANKLAWRPIDTAPKDSEQLIIISDGTQVEPAEWVPWGKAGEGFWSFCRAEPDFEPTYWMPLPDAPYANDTKEAG
jgi:hypothetical protein